MLDAALSLGVCLALAGEPTSPASEHQAPAPSLAAPARSLDIDRHNVLAEMWQRRILPADAVRWSAEDLALLRRVWAAEATGAVGLLKKRLKGAVKSFVVSFKPAGSGAPRPRLTREGYEKWLFFRSQDALGLFESKGVDAALVFQLTDVSGRALFDSNGRLTPTGEELYQRALVNLPAHWKTPNGQLYGNRPAASADGSWRAPAPDPEVTGPRTSSPGAPPVTGAAIEQAPAAAPSGNPPTQP